MAAIPSKPALHPLTGDDRGALIVIIAYSWIFITVLAAGIRFGLAWSNRLHLKKDDGTFALGVVRKVLIRRRCALLNSAGVRRSELNMLPRRNQLWPGQENGQGSCRRLEYLLQSMRLTTHFHKV